MGKQHLKKKIIPKTDFILLSEVVSEAKEKFEGYNLQTQLNQYLYLQGNIYNSAKASKSENICNICVAKHGLAGLLLNAIDNAFSKEARN